MKATNKAGHLIHRAKRKKTVELDHFCENLPPSTGKASKWHSTPTVATQNLP